MFAVLIGHFFPKVVAPFEVLLVFGFRPHLWYVPVRFISLVFATFIKCMFMILFLTSTSFLSQVFFLRLNYFFNLMGTLRLLGQKPANTWHFPHILEYFFRNKKLDLCDNSEVNTSYRDVSSLQLGVVMVR